MNSGLFTYQVIELAVNNEPQWIWKDAVVAKFDILRVSQYSCGETKTFSPCTGRDSNSAPSEQRPEALRSNLSTGPLEG
jgi:hypothetical protein